MHGRLLFGAVVLATILLFPASVQPAAPEFARPVATTDEVLPQGVVSQGAEPQVLVDRAGGYILVGDTANVHRSTNGGVTWTHPSVPVAPGVFDDGAALAQDAAGTLYAAQTQGQIVTVSKSTNGGVSWTMATQVPGVPFADRPWLAAGAAGQVALILNANFATDCYYSTDGATTWARVGSSPLNIIAGNAVLDSKGRLYFEVDGEIFKWEVPCLGFPVSAGTGGVGAYIQTQVAVEGENPTGANAYIAVPKVGNGAIEVRGLPGVTGGFFPNAKRVTVSDASLRSNTFPAIAVRSDGSEIAVAWYGTTTAGDPSVSSFPSSAVWNVYVARVSGFWTASPTVTTTLVATANHKGWFCMGGVSCTSGRNLLDYMGVAYGPDGSINVAYGDDNGNPSRVEFVRNP